jgi:hypothetical protein
VDESIRPVFQLTGPTDGAAWSQWGKTPAHGGQIDVAAQ